MEFQITRNHLFQTIPTLFKQWSISVDIMPIGIVTVWSNILLVGKGGYIAEYGDTTPGIYFWPNSTEIVIASAINGIKDNIEITDPKPINEWIRVEISQLRQSEGVYEFTIRIAELIVRQINNTDAREFSDVKVYTGDNFHPAANAKIANLTIETFPDNVIEVTKNHLYQTLPTLFKQWSMTVEIMPIGNNPKNESTNILHIGKGGDHNQYGDRNPAIWFEPLTTKMIIAAAINGTHHQISTDPIPINEWTRVEISQLHQADGVYQFTIRIAELIIIETNNADAREFSDVKVYTSNNFYLAANAKITNLTIDTFPDNVIEVTKNHLYQTLPTLFKQWSMSFEIMPMGLELSNRSPNILHVGLGGNRAQYGDRTPAIWFTPNTTRMLIKCDINGIRNYQLIITDPIPTNEWTRVEMSQLRQSDGVYQLTLRVAELILKQINNADAKDFSNVKVYTSDRFSLAANAKIANLTIETFPDNINIVTKNFLSQTIPTLFKQWSMIVDIMPMGIVNDLSNIVHVGLGGNNAQYGDRTPSIYFLSGTTKMRIYNSVSGNKQYFIDTDPIPMNEWTRVEISQLRQVDGVYQFTVIIAGSILTQKNNTDARDFPDVKVYTGDNFYPAANAKIASLMIETFPDNINTVPTLTPTLSPATSMTTTYSTTTVQSTHNTQTSKTSTTTITSTSGQSFNNT